MNNGNLLKFKGEIDTHDMAASLASASDHEQSLFFNVFFKALVANCEDEYRTGMQLVMIGNKLDSNAKKRINYIAEGEL